MILWCSAAQRGGVVLLLRRTLTVPRYPRFTSRLFSNSVPARCAAHAGQQQPPLKRWSFTVSPFSSIRAELACNISIRPLDLHTFPEADRAFVEVLGPDSEQQGQGGLDQIQVRYDDQRHELLISAVKVNNTVSIDVAAPIKSDIFITAQGEGNVSVKKMECDVCKIQTQRGNCVLHSVKGHRVEVESSGGHVTGLGTIHGNVDIITSGDSAVDVKKLQGTTMNVSTQHGPLRVKAIYAESSSVTSCSGRVELGHVHGTAWVKNDSGDTVIDGSNSPLTVSSRRGDIDVYVGEGGSAQLHSQEGSVRVRVPASLSGGVDLSGASVEVGPDVVLNAAENNTSSGRTTLTGVMNRAPPVERRVAARADRGTVTPTGVMNGAPPVERRVTARADRGTVTLKTQSWFETLKLGS